jgi:hypothetical protein
MKNKWKNGLDNMEKEISELTDKLKELRSRYNGVLKLINGRNTNIILGEKQNRFRINYRGKGIWYHIPTREGRSVVDINKRSVELTDLFIDDILSGRR